MDRYIIGIDTGGTFTDAVLIAAESGTILHTAKVPTTHHRLSEGTGNALQTLLSTSRVSVDMINAVAVSSTLATNSVVENKGARVALLVIGYVKHFKLPVKAVIFVKGGHTIIGEEEEPLELDYLVSILENLKEEVDAYGVCSAMSFKNPTHELVTEKAIAMIDPKPVFCSHRISNQAGMEERAATAGLHAKLMPIMQEYIDGVTKSLNDLHIHCPVHIIGGNGKPLSALTAAQHAGMTVASGPACTAFFGSLHAESDAIVIDVGGTTTDIAMVKNRAPLLAGDGCRIGDWKTHVEAVDMFTRGIGGDSHVHIEDDGTLSIGPRRVIPIATGNHRRDVGEWLGAGGKSKCINLVDGAGPLSATDEIIEILHRTGPATPADLRRKSGLSGIPLEKVLEKLSRKQYIEESGFTPTDALCVLDRITIGNREQARKAASILGSICNLDAEKFSTMVIEKTVEAIENCILEYITGLYWQKSLAGFIAARDNNPLLGVAFSLKIPIIGIGAAARFFLPEVAGRLRTDVHFPENFEVGNAIGAALICRKSLRLPSGSDRH